MTLVQPQQFLFILNTHIFRNKLAYDACYLNMGIMWKRCFFNLKSQFWPKISTSIKFYPGVMCESGLQFWIQESWFKKGITCKIPFYARNFFDQCNLRTICFVEYCTNLTCLSVS